MSRKGLRGRLSAKEVPFLVTLFLAWAGWAVGHFVDRVVASPTVEYKVTTKSTDGKKTTLVRLTNLSQQAFFGLVFEIHSKEIAACKVLHNKPPAWLWDVPPTVGTRGVAFEITQFQPGWEITLCTVSPLGSETEFFLKKSGTGSGNSKQAVRLVTPTLETFFVRYELGFMIILGAIALLMAIAWLWLSDGVEK